MNVTQLLQSIVDGLATGSTYSLVALSFTLVWATVRTVDLALLQIIALAGVVAFEVSGNGPVVALLAGVLAAVVVTTFSHYVAIGPRSTRDRSIRSSRRLDWDCWWSG